MSRREYEAEVLRLQRRQGRPRSLMSGAILTDQNSHVHHFVTKQELRRRKLFHLVYDPRNGGGFLIDEHVNHENASRRITREMVPVRTWEFCDEVGEWARHQVELAHPPEDARRDSTAILRHIPVEAA